MADSAFKIKDGNGTYRSVTDFMSAGDIKSSGVTFDDDSYYDSGDTAKYVIYRTPGSTNYFNYIWSDAHSIVGTYYRRAGNTQSPDFAKRGWAPTFANGSSWTPSATTSQIKYVSGTGLQYRNSTSGSWTTLSNTLNSPIILIETQGAGGGGGGACVNAGTEKTHSYSGGGGGASGAYSAHVLDLSDGAEYTLVKGTGGAAGNYGYEASGTAGSRGGSTVVKKSGSTIISTPGGPGGNAATHKTGTTEAGGTSSSCVLGDCTYMTVSGSSAASSAYGNQFCYSLGAKGGKGAGPTESSNLSGSAGSTSDNIGTIFKRSGVGSAGAGGSTTTGMTKTACGGGGGGSVLGNGGKGHDSYQSGSNWYTSGTSGGYGGGGGGGAYGWNGSQHLRSAASKGGDGQIIVWYQTSYKEP